MQDIPAAENTDHYMFQNLEPNKNYTISVSMRNAVGDGPPAVIYITTPPEPAGRNWPNIALSLDKIFSTPNRFFDYFIITIAIL